MKAVLIMTEKLHDLIGELATCFAILYWNLNRARGEEPHEHSSNGWFIHDTLEEACGEILFFPTGGIVCQEW